MTADTAVTRRWLADLAWLPGQGVRREVLIEADGDRFTTVTPSASATPFASATPSAGLLRLAAGRAEREQGGRLAERLLDCAAASLGRES